MLNPWLSVSLQAARLGWETQSLVVDQMMRLAGVSVSDRKAAAALDQNTTAVPVGDVDARKTQTLPVAHVAAPANSSKHARAAQKVMKLRKRHRLRKRRRSH
jgi:hypothetical protein